MKPLPNNRHSFGKINLPSSQAELLSRSAPMRGGNRPKRVINNKNN